MFIEITDLKKSYGEGVSYVQVLRGICAEIKRGQICTILGPSGSGKSTLLNALGGLEQVDSGKILVDGRDIVGLSSKETALYRRNYLGFIFQFYNLVPNLTVRENIQTCEYLAKKPLDIDLLIDTLDLREHEKKMPSQISGGQQQRCAIARALVKNPKLLLCDEPTGALDYKNSKELLVLLQKVNQDFNTTMLIVTHNEAIKDMAHSVLRIKDGRVSQSYINTKPIPARELEW